VLASMATMKPPRAVARSRSTKEQSNEISESVYALGHQADVSVAPRVRTYNVTPADHQPSAHGGAASPKVRMHADSSQVGHAVPARRAHTHTSATCRDPIAMPGAAADVGMDGA
jgi:hypothetical protein